MNIQESRTVRFDKHFLRRDQDIGHAFIRVKTSSQESNQAWFAGCGNAHLTAPSQIRLGLKRGDSQHHKLTHLISITIFIYLYIYPCFEGNG